MSVVSLSDLVSIASYSDILTIELSIAQGLSLPTTAWQPLSMARTLLGINAELASQLSGEVNLIAQGGYASYAALMVDVTGAPVTTWMDLIGTNNYNEPRITISYASGPVPVSNSTASAYPYTVGQLHFQNSATGATYSNTAAGTIAAHAANAPIAAQADVAWGGTAGTTGAGVVLTLLTPLPGVTVSALTASLVGSDAESNSAYLLRCQNKLGTLSALLQLGSGAPAGSPGGPAQAYKYVATTIPQASVASSTYPFAVTAPITRVSAPPSSGAVVVYVANAAGQPPGPDIAAVGAAVQLFCVPQAVAAFVVGAANLLINITYTVYVRSGGNSSNATILANIADDLANYFATIPIGGVSTASANIVPKAELVALIMAANPGTLDMTLSPLSGANSRGDVPVLASQVPALGTVTGTVVTV